jgi:magnesium transporter
MPELHWRSGYLGVVVVVTVTCAVLFVRFRRAGWI